jgi:hypothetical protein
MPASLKPKQTVKATVVGQDGKSRTVTIHLGKLAGQRPAAPGRLVLPTKTGLRSGLRHLRDRAELLQ